jgi:hypothetical protein
LILVDFPGWNDKLTMWTAEGGGQEMKIQMTNYILLMVFASFLLGCPARTVIKEQPSRNEPLKAADPAYNKTHKTDDLSDYELIAKIEEEREIGWIFYGESSTGVYFFQENSIIDTGTIIRAWTKRISKRDSLEHLSRTLIEINCKERMFRVLSRTSYDKKGAVVGSSGIETKWRHITPETVMESLFSGLGCL